MSHMSWYLCCFSHSWSGGFRIRQQTEWWLPLPNILATGICLTTWWIKFWRINSSQLIRTTIWVFLKVRLKLRARNRAFYGQFSAFVIYNLYKSDNPMWQFNVAHKPSTSQSCDKNLVSYCLVTRFSSPTFKSRHAKKLEICNHLVLRSSFHIKLSKLAKVLARSLEAKYTSPITYTKIYFYESK